MEGAGAGGEKGQAFDNREVLRGRSYRVRVKVRVLGLRLGFRFRVQVKVRDNGKS